MNNHCFRFLSMCLFISLFTGRYCSLYSQDDFNEWLNKELENYQKYLEEDDKKFIQFLKTNWTEFQIQHGIPADEPPKPIATPVYRKPAVPDPEIILEVPEDIEPQINDPVKTENIIETNVPPETPPAAVEEAAFPIVDAKKNPYNVKVSFFGAENQFRLDRKFKVTSSSKVTIENIGDYWKRFSAKNYKEMIAQTKHYKNKMRLNDWGYFLLVKKLADDLYGGMRNEKQLFIWFILNKSGYKCKVGMINDEVFVFAPSKNRIFEVPFIKEGEEPERLYVINFENLTKPIEGGIYTYKGDYPGADNLLDLNINYSPDFSGKKMMKERKFLYKNKEYVIPINYTKGVVDFYRNYPNVSLSVYFNALPMRKGYDAMIAKLKECIIDKTEVEAVNFILHFVQEAFDYKTDEENFKREKPLFVEETIHYAYSDCEDRAILFSHLVRELVGLKVIGLDYPGHVAAAVRFNQKVPGDYLKYKGEIYTVCDPTYIGADIGISMPEYKNKKLEDIIEINN